MGLFRRGKIWFGRVKDRRGKWVKKTLNTEDRSVAIVRYRELERGEADPTYRAAHQTTLATAAESFLISRRVKGCAAGTLSMYEQKIAHLGRLFGDDTALSAIDATAVDRYLSTRLEESASRSTIGKELTTLRGVLKVAKRAGLFDKDLDSVLPSEWHSDYEPRKTALTVEQLESLLAELEPERACTVAFIVATGARWGEARRARREHIDTDGGLVYFAISKTRQKGMREKWVPITVLTASLVDRVLTHLGDRSEICPAWGNVLRDLARACSRSGVPKVTPNDLRRTHSNWLRDAGVDATAIAEVLGHVDSRMVEKVYGRLRPEQLRNLVTGIVDVKDGTRTAKDGTRTAKESTA